jgi:hypothetical protein
MSGTNAFKRSVQDRRLSKNLTDARSERNFATFPEEVRNEVIVENISGRRFVRSLPTDQQRWTDPVQLKARPIYRLIREEKVVTGNSCRCSCGKCQ